MEILTPTEVLLLGGSTICGAILIFYYLFLFRVPFNTVEPIKQSDTPLSVIIAARNELKNLQAYLPAILEQDYPSFEVVVVNDGSHDGSEDFLKELLNTSSKLKVVNLEMDERFRRGKKFALTMGIKAAANENLVFTDADCYPVSNNWLKQMANALVSKDLALGVSPLVVKNNILGSLVSYETLHTSIQYLGYSKRNLSYMGVGRNLAYTKTLFFKNKGFASHQHILSGDDDLFVQQASLGTNTALVTSESSLILSNGPGTFKTWIKQKIRHLSTGKEYKTKYKSLLGLYSLCQISMYIFTIAFITVNPTFWYLALAILGIKWLVQLMIFLKPAKIFRAKKVQYFLPYYDILYTLYLLFFGIVKLFIKPKTWN